MAGMLPGVECARRRRFHQGGSTDFQSSLDEGRTRRSSFCLYTSSHGTSRQTLFSSGSQRFQSQRMTSSQWFEEGKPAEIAREAKQRLDERLKTQINSEFRRYNSMGNILPRGTVRISEGESSRTVTKSRGGEENYNEGLDSTIFGSLQREVFNKKKKSSRKFNWAKLSWKASEQDECAVCLECFKLGEVLVHVPCAHRFHSACLLPWLRSHSICPCCRMEIMVQKPLEPNYRI